ncbi:MAG: DUF695 domain-containing protein [Bacteroidota bacterium]
MKTGKTIVLLMGILSLFTGCKQEKKAASKNTSPKEEFAILEATLENGKPAIGSFNLYYKSYEDKVSYPWCLKIAIALDEAQCHENGLANPQENTIAVRMEDEFLEKIQKITSSHYIGHVFNDTFLDIYIYLDHPEKVHQWLQTQIKRKGLAREFGYEINKDATWETVQQFFN